jgi:hypothetical protein
MKNTKTTNCWYGRLNLHIIHILVWLGAVTCVVALLYHRNQRFEVLMTTEDIRAKTGPVASTNAPLGLRRRGSDELFVRPFSPPGRSERHEPGPFWNQGIQDAK